MGAMTWSKFWDVYPRAHLVIARLDAVQTAEARRSRFDLLKQLVAASGPRGDWSLVNVNLDGRAEIHLAYERAADAARLATLVHAEPLDPRPGRLSQSAFDFDNGAQKLIMGALKK